MTRASAFVLGYHGCDRAIGEMVLANKEHLTASRNDYDWLGTGIYFWENSARRALDWAKSAKNNPNLTQSKVTAPFVVGAIIDLGNCLDLLEAESIRIAKRAHSELTEAGEALDFPMPKNTIAKSGERIPFLDCAVINYVHDMRWHENEVPFDTVRAVFIEGAPLYEGAGFHEKTHVQICVRKPRQIIAYFRPMNVA